MHYEIVPMDRSHISQIAQLERECFSTPWTEAMLEEELFNPQASFIVAEDDEGNILGYAGLHVVLDEGYIDNIAVQPDARRHGVASALLDVYCRFGAVNLAFTVAAMVLVDRWGRRPLMLMGAGGLALIYAALGCSYFFGLKGIWVLGLVLAAIACYAMTLAPVTWVVLSEIFPGRIRGTAMSVAVGALWISCYGLTLTFKPLNLALGAAGTFWFYGALCLVGVAVLATWLRETKGRALAQD